jgi:hypothetical protein
MEGGVIGALLGTVARLGATGARAAASAASRAASAAASRTASAASRLGTATRAAATPANLAKLSLSLGLPVGYTVYSIVNDAKLAREREAQDAIDQAEIDRQNAVFEEERLKQDKILKTDQDAATANLKLIEEQRLRDKADYDMAMREIELQRKKQEEEAAIIAAEYQKEFDLLQAEQQAAMERQIAAAAAAIAGRYGPQPSITPPRVNPVPSLPNPTTRPPPSGLPPRTQPAPSVNNTPAARPPKGSKLTVRPATSSSTLNQATHSSMQRQLYGSGLVGGYSNIVNPLMNLNRNGVFPTMRPNETRKPSAKDEEIRKERMRQIEESRARQAAYTAQYIAAQANPVLLDNIETQPNPVLLDNIETQGEIMNAKRWMDANPFICGRPSPQFRPMPEPEPVIIPQPVRRPKPAPAKPPPRGSTRPGPARPAPTPAKLTTADRRKLQKQLSGSGITIKAYNKALAERMKRLLADA